MHLFSNVCDGSYHRTQFVHFNHVPCNTHNSHATILCVDMGYHRRVGQLNCVPDIAHGSLFQFLPNGVAIAHVSLSGTWFDFCNVCDAFIAHSLTLSCSIGGLIAPFCTSDSSLGLTVGDEKMYIVPISRILKK